MYLGLAATLDQLRQASAQIPADQIQPEAKARIEAQTTSVERVARANYVIDSSGPKDKTRLQVVEVWRQILEAAKAKR